MAANVLELKEYQQASLDALRRYLKYCVQFDDADLAFMKETRIPYRQAPLIAPGTPYVCLRIPTGGGKTIMASHAVCIAAFEYMQVSNPMVLWLVPSDAILEQTLAALKNLDHPYRTALANDFGRNVNILSKDEALSMSRADAEAGATIIVSTIQSFRIDDTKGRKVYDDSGQLMDHFSGLSEAQIERLEKVEGTQRPVASLANLLSLHNAMVIVDEAHNARTSLSFDTLARFSPSLILELTATPQTDHDPARHEHASNILHSVSAAELKAEEMIKLPIRLTTDTKWRKTVGAALDCQSALEEAAKAEKAETNEYIRPLILFQAQSASRNDPHRLTWDVIEQHLLEDKRIPKEQIAVHTGPRKDLDDLEYPIDDERCPVRYIITVQKLKEGWDCPFAYVLCSVAEQVSQTAIEQILGRVLRMPKAKRKQRDALNRAYAFVAAQSFDDAAQKLKDGLVEGAGFNRIEAEQLITSQGDIGFAEDSDDYEFESDPIDDDAETIEAVAQAIDRLPAAVKARVAIDRQSGSLRFKGPMSKDSRNTLQLALAKIPQAERVLDRLHAKSNNIPIQASAEENKPPFIVPLMGFRKQGELELFSKEHFLDLPWRLDECDATSIVERFKLRDESEEGEIDVTDKGKVEIGFVGRMQEELAAVIQEPAWTLPRLVNWIDSGIKHSDVTKPSAVAFISNALRALEEQGFSLDVLARNKYDLRKAVVELISELRGEREQAKYSALFADDASSFAVSSELAMIFDEERYAYNKPYRGGTLFNKHYMDIVGDLKPQGEEFDCAVHIDRCDDVRYWVRNVELKKSSFWLQLPHQKFYPDFVAMLTDGRILVVEYKGADRFEGEQQKRDIGNAWADASGGHCLFCMPTDRKFDLIDRTIAGR